MTIRITRANLDAIAYQINLAAGAPTKYVAGGNNAGHFYFSSAYGGYKLVRVSNARGGESDIMGNGHLPIRQAYNEAVAFYRGMYFIRTMRKGN